MMQSPQTLAGLCMNQTAFRAVFVPAPGDTYSIALLHQSLCGLAGVNITLLYEQLSASVEGLKEYSNIVSHYGFNSSLMHYSRTFIFHVQIQNGLDFEYL